MHCYLVKFLATFFNAFGSALVLCGQLSNIINGILCNENA
jgi:hypothetical protein